MLLIWHRIHRILAVESVQNRGLWKWLASETDFTQPGLVDSSRGRSFPYHEYGAVFLPSVHVISQPFPIIVIILINAHLAESTTSASDRDNSLRSRSRTSSKRRSNGGGSSSDLDEDQMATAELWPAGASTMWPAGDTLWPAGAKEWPACRGHQRVLLERTNRHFTTQLFCLRCSVVFARSCYVQYS